MVLQTGEPVRLWGWARPGERVCIRFADQERSVCAGDDGRWRVWLEAMEPEWQGRDISISTASENRIVRDVQVGQVWVCSGQSNMAMRVAEITGAERLLAQTEFPPVRMFNPPWSGDWNPREDVPGRWREVGRAELKWFSAIAYVFGCELLSRLKQPVGLIVSHVGASKGEAWVERSALLGEPRLSRIHRIVQEKEKAHPLLRTRGNGYFRQWHRDFKAYWREFRLWSNRAETRRGPPPVGPTGVADKHVPSVLYNGMIAPLTPYVVRGVLWYQGEGNANRVDDAYEYRFLLPTLIASWRRAWGKPRLPFYFVQLPEFEAPEKGSWALIRESMLLTWQQVPDTGMAVSIGYGKAKEVHPPDKIPVAHRLARIALARTYGYKLAYSGPLFERAKLEGGRLRLFFSHVHGGLSCAGGELTDFEIASESGAFLPAQAEIDGEQVVVWNDAIKTPAHVRYAWSDMAQPTLFNSEGLPASPFRTDTCLIPGQTDRFLPSVPLT